MMLKRYLEKYFGYKDFLQGQETAIKLICQGKDTLVVMPTGGGKSLCYQLPALVMPGVALVISPLIALMKDQLDSLLKLGYPATFLNSSLSREESIERLQAVRNKQYKLIYIAPEKLSNGYFLKVLSEIPISFLAIDEAHCISEWGHDFRPAYLNIIQSLKSINISHTVALTATATPDVRQDIVSTLNMKEANVLAFGFDRTNLSYFTEYTTNKASRVAELLLESSKISNKQQGSTIIYCGTRKQVEETHHALAANKTLLSKNIVSTYYHGGLNDATRYENQNKFMSSEVNVIVATNAFGMGIDKSNVRHVVHIHLPSSVEAYYQEAGRAGRDGLPASCYLLYDNFDGKLGEWFIEKNFPKRADFEAVYGYLFSQIKPNQTGESLIRTSAGIPINAISIALNIERNTVLQVLKHFAMLQIVERNSFPKKAKIAFNYSKNEMLKILNSLPALYRVVFEALIRSFPNSDQNKYFELDMLYLSRKYNITLQEMSYSINYFADRQIISLELAKPGDSISVIAEYRDFAALNIDFQKQQIRKEWMLSKLQSMQEYATTLKCKRNFILEYFDDKTYSSERLPHGDTCGRCSSCLELYDMKDAKPFFQRKKKTNNNMLLNRNITKHNSHASGNFLSREDSSANIAAKQSDSIPEPMLDIIHSMFRNGETIDTVAKILKKPKGDIANMLQVAIEQEQITEYWYYTSQHFLDEVKGIVLRSPGILLRDVQRELQEPVDMAMLRVVVAFARL